MKNGNVFGSDSKTYNAYRQPLWLEVKEKKIGGGTISLANYKKGDLIPAAAPVHLAKMGGEAVLIDAFKVVGAVTSESTAVKLEKGVFGTTPAKGMIVGKVASTGIAAKAVALGDYTEGTGFAISANALGSLSDGDYLYICAAAGSNKPAVLPEGLTLREIYVDTANPTVGTVAVVTKGQILADRMTVALTDWQEAALKGNITFEKEL